jgi:putative toxin-antitoxin system antitoxin component (TIGR02293 family)
MAKASAEANAGQNQRFQQVASLLGGRRVLNHQPSSRLEVHELILHGLPAAALRHLVEGIEILRQPASMEKALGISVRTFQRHKDAPAKPLSQEQSGRVWEFADILTKASSVLGSRQEAEQWLARPAIALEQRPPLDLLATPEGRRLVEELLERMEYGVYM